MRTIYQSILLIGLSAASLTLNAQTAAKDTVLNKQVILQREYSPTINEASRINSNPSIFEPNVQKKSLNFEQKAPQLLINNNRLGDSRAGEIMTDVEYSKKRGYAQIAAGNYANIDGALGYRIVNSKRDRLNLFGSYDATSGKLSYAESMYYKRMKAKYSDINVNLNYQHTFDPSILSIEALYRNLGYNYYGNPFISNEQLDNLDNLPNFDKKQNVSVIGFAAALKSRDESKPALNYDGKISYRSFKSKYGTHPELDGQKGGQLNVQLDLNTEFDSEKWLGIDMYVMNQSLSNALNDDNMLHVYGVPYIRFEGSNWKAKLGAKAGFITDYKNSFIVAPDLYASVKLGEFNSLYASVTGGINENTFLQVLEENRYANPLNRIGYSRTVYDAELGVNIGAFAGVEFDIFAGYKQTNRDHLYITNAPFSGNSNNPTLDAIYAWGNVSDAVYANLSRGKVGALFKTNLIPQTNLWARAIVYAYNVKYKGGNLKNFVEEAPAKKEAWGLPTATAELHADVKDVILPNLTLSMDYTLELGRKAYFGGRSISMKNVNELNFRADYRVMDWISINARVNNVFSQKYERVYGYTHQGINFMGGLNLKF